MHPSGSERIPVYYHSLPLSPLFPMWYSCQGVEKCIEPKEGKGETRDTCGRYCSRFCWRDEPSNLAVSQGKSEKSNFFRVRTRGGRGFFEVRGRKGRARNGFCRKWNRWRGRDIPRRPTTDLSYTPTSPTATGVPPLFSPSECFFRRYFSPPNFEIFRFVDLPLLGRGGRGGALRVFGAREFSFKSVDRK